MRFSSLNLKAFGLFTDYEVTFPDSNNFYIIHGSNEAGKSTVLRAITALLYGIPERTTDSFLHNKPLIEGSISISDGSKLDFARRKGRKNTLVEPGSNNPLSDSVLQKFLNNIDRDTFIAMFGMDHERLRRGGENILKGGGVVGETLFEAAAGVSYIRNLLSELNDETDKLFKKSASKPLINSKIKEYKEAKQNQNELSMAASAWAELEKDYKEKEQKLEKFVETIKECKKQKAKYERIKRVLPLLTEKKKYSEELTSLSDVPRLRETFCEERQELMAARDKAYNDKKRIQQEREKLEQRASELSIPEGILDTLPLISELHEKLDAYRNSINDLPDLKQQYTSKEQEAMANLKEIDPSLNSLDQVEHLRLTFEQKEEIHRLISENRNLQNEMNKIEERIKTHDRSLQKNLQEREKLGEHRDADSLARAVEIALKQGNLEDELRNNREKAEMLQSELLNKLNTLGLWSGTPEEFEKLTLPLPETVKVFEERFDDINNLIKDTEREIKDCEENISAPKDRIENIEASGDVPTEEQLAEDRSRRERGWELVKKSWLHHEQNPEEEKEFDPDNPLETAYEESVLKADETADLLYKDANNVAIKEACLREVDKYETKLEDYRREKNELEERYSKLEGEWAEVWEETGITPLLPREMLDWLERCEAIREKIKELNLTVKEIKRLEELIAKHRSEINSALKALGENDVEGETFENLVNRAQKIARDIENKANKIKSNEESREQIESDLHLAQTEKEQVKESMDAWQKSWTESMKQLGLAADTDVSIAEELIKKIDELFRVIKERDDLNRRIDIINNYIDGFESKAMEIIKKVAPDLVEMPYQSAVASLHERAEKAKDNNVTREEIKISDKNLQKDLEAAEREYEEAENGLSELIKEAGCNDLSEVELVEQRYNRVCELSEKISELENRLIQVGEGLSLDEIYKEAENADHDSVAAEIQELEHRLEQMESERSEIDQEFGVVKNEYEKKLEGNSTAALEAAEKAQGLLAEISADTERYVKLRLASAVLSHGIERYRQENQNPILEIASEIFSKLTMGSFSKLKVDYDEKDNPVIAGVRPSEQTVFVSGMSDGTQDQLYLSLRLAFVRKYCEDTEPMPLILDDILVNFDDKRSEETIKVLADVSQKTQVIFFTHHNALVDLARNNVPGRLLQVHELE